LLADSRERSEGASNAPSFARLATSTPMLSAPKWLKSSKAKFVRNVYYDVGLIRASRKAEADF
jgi:hypothetical protein